MNVVGTPESPLRVAVIGAGPAGFYVAEALYKHPATVTVDMYDRLPTPFGLVRHGVAPDHQKIKSVTRVFDRVAARPGFRFFGNVEIGKHLSVADLRRHYHQIVYTTGAQTDRRLNIPGIDLANSHSATEFVAWYNGHPDFRHLTFDLSAERVAVIGVGNVAVDVCRILCRTPEELAETDIADYALAALRESKVKDVFMLGRRGPAQAAFTAPELKELGELSACDVIIRADEAALDDLSRQSLAESADRGTTRKVQLVHEFSEREPAGHDRRLHLRFLVSPSELVAGEDGRIQAMKLVKNELYATEMGTLRPRATDHIEEVPVELVFRSIGYHGVPLADVPFNDSWGVIRNAAGRVVDPDDDCPRVGEYAAGWIKRGPTGVIGTNKPDAAETAEAMMSDWEAGQYLPAAEPAPDAIAALIAERQPDFFTYDDWQALDALEVAAGEASGRPRVKFTAVADMLAALNRNGR